MKSAVTPTDSTAEKLLRAVSTLAAEKGAAELTSRAVAESAGVSASAVNYSFGSLDQLLEAARRDGDAMRALFWVARAAELEELDSQVSDLGPALFIATRELAIGHPGEEALFWADVIEAARLSRAVSATAALTAERRFWSRLLETCALDTNASDVLHAFSLALRFGYLITARPERFDPWAMALVNRFAARLLGGPRDAPQDSAYRKRAEDRANLSEIVPIPEHETAQLILKTAIQTILEDGTDGATIREIARRAGLSVSSVQHFFGSRRAYLTAAFQSIYTTARDRAVHDLPDTNSLTISELARQFDQDRSGSPVQTHREFAAMQGLMMSAARDADTYVLAEGLLARAGQTSHALLSTLKAPNGEIGRLDAQILSLTLVQFVTLEVCGLTPERSAGEHGGIQRVEHVLNTLFFDHA